VNQPVTPCSSGVRPVYDVVIAEAVVEGNTEVIVPRRRRASSPPAARCISSRSPRPSTMSSTTFFASLGSKFLNRACSGFPPRDCTIEAMRLTRLPPS
jgi:hypothetical protein